MLEKTCWKWVKITRSIKFVDFRMILRTSGSCRCELIHYIFNMRLFRKVVTAIICDEIRADEGASKLLVNNTCSVSREV